MLPGKDVGANNLLMVFSEEKRLKMCSECRKYTEMSSQPALVTQPVWKCLSFCNIFFTLYTAETRTVLLSLPQCIFFVCLSVLTLLVNSLVFGQP